jgi:hypothetical protein
VRTASKAQPKPAGRSANRSVFINCPFDRTYRRFFEAIVFAVYASGFIPRCALEIDDGAEVRFTRICRIIESCGFSIHDLSRAGADPRTRLARFNMPLELGLFLGCKYFGGPNHAGKSCLILDGHSYRYRKFVSDLAGQDVRSHNFDLLQLIAAIRNWLRAGSRQSAIPGGRKIYDRYRSFQNSLPKICRQAGIARSELTFVDFSSIVKYWLKTNRMRTIKLL